MLPRLTILTAISVLSSDAAVVVNDPSPTTNRVFINVIQFATSTGVVAQDFGTPAQEAYIKAQTDRILNQAGIDVEFSPTITVVNDFAYDGFPNDYSATPRPQDDLDTIRFELAATPNYSDAEVINLYLVEIVPGFSALNDFSANGLAYLDSNGIAMHIGSNLLLSDRRRDIVASVLAHEIGHNLGLRHTENGTDNLMSPGGTSDQLTQTQITTIYDDHSGLDGFDLAKPLGETNFDAYLAASGLSGGETDDADFDGLPNLLEFALGTDPAFADRSRLDPLQQVGAGSINLDFRKRASALEDGVAYFLEYSTDLSAPWLNVGSGSPGSILIEDSDFRIAGGNNNGGTEFMRLRIARSAPAPFQRSARAASPQVEMQPPATAHIADCLCHRSFKE